MKKVLLGTSALLLTTSIAWAEVSVGGDGRMGIVGGGTDDTATTGTDETDLAFTSRIRISFSASGETDGGLTFGGSIRADNSVGGAAGTAGSVFAEGAFGKISMGDVSGAPEAAVGDVSGVGLTGLGDYNEMTYLSNTDRSAMRYDYVTGSLGFHVSADNPGAFNTSEAIGVAVTYGMGDISFGLGYEENETSDHLIGGVSAGFGDATVKAIYGTADLAGTDFDQYGVSLDYVFGAATATAFFVSKDTGGTAVDTMGVGMAYDLGGGASLKGGYVDSDAETDGRYDFGLSMSF
ncbi:MAG: porin [Silicimonas sp.]